MELDCTLHIGPAFGTSDVWLPSDLDALPM